MPDQPSRAERYGEMGAKYREGLIIAMAKVYGNRPSDAQALPADEEVRLWRLPTSPAAVEAFKRGATMEEAEEANRLWANNMKQQQQALTDQGVPFEQIQQMGLTDEAIFATCRKHAFERGKASGKDDPEIEARYHADQAKRVAAQRAGRPLIAEIDSQDGVV